MDIPPEFVCPITSEPMRFPLMTRTGLNFERDAILDWMSNYNNSCPITRQPLTARDLVPNHALKWEIDAWRRYLGLDDVEVEGGYKDSAVRVFVCARNDLEPVKSKKKEAYKPLQKSEGSRGLMVMLKRLKNANK
jgi:SUMO ligase MMS21 Smc5/6 complex component